MKWSSQRPRSLLDAIPLGSYPAIIGIVSILVSLSSYYFLSNAVILGPGIGNQLDNVAAWTLIVFALGIALVLVGVHFVFKEVLWTSKTSSGRASLWYSLASTLSTPSHNWIFVLSGLVYSLIFAVLSGTIVYDPTTSFTIQYSAAVPSTQIIACCDPIGQTPRLVVYLTDHVGILIVPTNVLLLVAVSWLVGANISLAVYTYKARVAGTGVRKWLGGFGATTGLFTACPTCAGAILLGGLGAGEALAAAYAPIQLVLVGLTAMLLFGNLLFMGNKVGVSCLLPKTQIE